MRTVATIVVVIVFALIFDRLEVPAGSLLGAGLGAALMNLVGGGVTEGPDSVVTAAFIVLGWKIGQSVTGEALSELGSQLPAILGIVVFLVAAGGVAAWALVGLGVLDTQTAYLATSPGALSQMSALAADGSADGLFVVTVHTVRVLVVVLVAPLVVRLLA